MVVEPVLNLFEAVGLALLGGCVHLALCAYEAEKVPGKWQIFGHVVISPVAGFLFWLAAFPNHLNVFFAGFFSTDFIRMLARVYKPKPEAASGPPMVGSGHVERVIEWTTRKHRRRIGARG